MYLVKGKKKLTYEKQKQIEKKIVTDIFNDTKQA